MCRVLMKYTLFLVNLLFTIIGLAIIGIGVAAIYVLDDLFESLTEANIPLHIVPYVIIGVGVIIFLIAFSGCCGSITECQCLLITYAILMLLLAGAKIYLTVVVFTQGDKLKRVGEEFVSDTFDDPDKNIAFHGLELLLQCCGKNGPDDYNYTHNGEDYLPPTCCGKGVSADGWDADDIENISCLKQDGYEKGCTTLIGEIFDRWTRIIGYVLIGCIIVEVGGLLFSTFIACTIKRK